MENTAAAAPPALRVFVVDDSPLIRERLEALIGDAGASLAGCADSVEAAIAGILRERPQLVILDMQLGSGTGFDVLRALREQAPEIDVYLLSNYASYPYRDLAARLGARGFFDKSTEMQLMRQTLAVLAAAAH